MIAGPTASGKSKLALQLAKHLGYEIYSTDSRQCYQGLPIGTASPTEEERAQITHYNIGILAPDAHESSAHFISRLQNDFPSFQKEEGTCLPLVFVGGSTLHNEALLFGLDEIPPANKENLKALEEEHQKFGGEYLLNRLWEVDPVYAQRMDGFNRQRCFRALDVWMQSGKAFSSFHQRDQKTPKIPVFVVELDRKELYQRINTRVEQMWEQGLVEEYQAILEAGYPKDAHALQSVGYREVEAYLSSEMSREEAIEKMQTQTRRYAKRQITWYKRWDFASRIGNDEQAFAKVLNTLERQAKHS